MRITAFCDIRAEGRNPYAFINAVRQSEIFCGSQYCKGEVFYCRVKKADLPKLQELAKQYHIVLHIQEHDAILSRFKKYRFRFGIPLGILLSILLIFYNSNIIMQIDIRGNTLVSESQILALLEQEGISKGTWIADIDMNHCETMLRVKIPEIAWAGIRNSGNRLVIEITEETPSVDMIAERTPCHIIAKYDAQITNVRVYSGQLQCLIGDGVAKGDIIVSGIITDDKNHVNYRHALASVTGIYTLSETFTENYEISETLETGNTTRQKWLQILNLQIPLYLSKPDYTECSQTESYTPFCFLEHTLPCGILQRVTNETQTSITQRSEEDVLLALHADIVRYEKNFLSDVEILDCETEYIADESGITCQITYTVEGEIGMDSDFFVQK